MSILAGLEAATELLEEHAGWTDDEHGHDTPERFIRMLDELTACAPKYLRSVDGGIEDVHEKLCIKWKSFPCGEDEQDMIIVKDIPFVSVCNHHVIPIIGKAHIGYVPELTITGLSKFARVVRHFARQLQVQERMTKQVADYLYARLEPKGLGVVIQAEHLCMTIRGVQTPGTYTVTSTMRGVFGEHSRTAKAEFMAIVNSNGHK